MKRTKSKFVHLLHNAWHLTLLEWRDKSWNVTGQPTNSFNSSHNSVLKKLISRLHQDEQKKMIFVTLALHSTGVYSMMMMIIINIKIYLYEK